VTQEDAKRVEANHTAVHGVRGMIGSLDCLHIVWENYPIAHHDQYQGKEGRPMLVFEAMMDYTLYAWHALFGYYGTLNDIIFWDNNLFLQAIIEVFQQLWILVGEIYPPIFTDLLSQYQYRLVTKKPCFHSGRNQNARTSIISLDASRRSSTSFQSLFLSHSLLTF
jgi:hypothetical protein